MKKKIVLLLGLLMLSLAGCQGDMETTESSDASNEQEEALEEEVDNNAEDDSVNEDSNETETTEDSEEESLEEETEGNAETENTLSDVMPAITELTGNFYTWAGIHMGEYVAESEFDDYLKGDLIAFAVSTGGLEAYPYVPWEQDSAYAYITPEQVQELSQLFFGTSLDTTALPRVMVLQEARFAADAAGGIIVSVGDWGLSMPMGESYFTMEEDGTVVAEYIYDMWEFDFMLSDNCYVDRCAYSQIGTVTYTCTPMEESPLGYVITDVSLEPEVVSYADFEAWPGTTATYESMLGYQILVPETLNGRITFVNQGGIDYYISNLCEEENYGGVLLMVSDNAELLGTDAIMEFVDAEGSVFYAAYPDSQQYDEDNEEKVREYRAIQKYVIAMLYSASN